MSLLIASTSPSPFETCFSSSIVRLYCGICSQTLSIMPVHNKRSPRGRQLAYRRRRCHGAARLVRSTEAARARSPGLYRARRWDRQAMALFIPRRVFDSASGTHRETSELEREAGLGYSTGRGAATVGRSVGRTMERPPENGDVRTARSMGRHEVPDRGLTRQHGGSARSTCRVYMNVRYLCRAVSVRWSLDRLMLQLSRSTCVWDASRDAPMS